MNILLLFLACQESEKKTDTTTSTPETICEDPVEIACLDDLILDLSLQADKISDGAVSNEQDGNDFVTSVDGSAGGYMEASNNPWVYIKFTAQGAEKVEIDDETIECR